MTTTSTSTTSAINFDLKNLAGNSLLFKGLTDYFMFQGTSTFNVYYSFREYEIPFLIKIRKDYISMIDAHRGEDVMRVNITGQKKKNWSEAALEAREFTCMIGAFIGQYLNDCEDEGLFDE